MLLRIVGICFVGGLLGSLAHAALSRHAAKAAIGREGYAVQALDREKSLPCPRLGQGFTFVATRDGHLVAGGVCVLMLTRPDILVTLPNLR